MVRPCGGVDGKERGRLSASDVVGAWDVYREEDDVIDVNIVRASGVDGDADD
jgi:hypothetical protein